MKFFRYLKDGGPLSRVWGLYIVEIKKLFSIVLLRFLDGSREAYHSHAFNSVAWVLRGTLVEHEFNGKVNVYTPSLLPFFVPRDRFHKVVSEGTTWVLNLRGPWADEWQEFLPDEQALVTLTHGRIVKAKV